MRATEALELSELAWGAQPVCRPCQLGQYCEEGSGTFEVDVWILEETQARQEQDNIEFLCEEGAYCPRPNEMLDCPEGYFCDVGSRDPKTCALYNMAPETPILGKEEMLMDKIKRGSPLGGNYCGVGSRDPMGSCSAGYYCPTPRKKIECPKGYFCKEFTVAPKKCSLWASCPKGSKSPGFKNLELALTLVFIVICVLLCKVALRMQDRARGNQCVPPSALTLALTLACAAMPYEPLATPLLPTGCEDSNKSKGLTPAQSQYLKQIKRSAFEQ